MGIAGKEDRHYSSNDENLLVAISRQLATAIEKVQLYEETCRRMKTCADAGATAAERKNVGGRPTNFGRGA